MVQATERQCNTKRSSSCDRFCSSYILIVSYRIFFLKPVYKCRITADKFIFFLNVNCNLNLK